MTVESTSSLTTVDQLRPGNKNVNVVVQVVEAKVIERKGPKGAVTKTVECIVGDSSAAIVLSTRGEGHVDTLQAGAYVTLQNAKVEVLRGSMRLVLDKSSKAEAAEGHSFRPAVATNLSLIEFEMVTVASA